jgi:hypothetical protein
MGLEVFENGEHGPVIIKGQILYSSSNEFNGFGKAK